jgi:hypothetical protein
MVVPSQPGHAAMTALASLAVAAFALYLAMVLLDRRRAAHSYCKRMQNVGR